MLSFILSLFSGYPIAGGLQLGRWLMYNVYFMGLVRFSREVPGVQISGLLHFLSLSFLSLGWIQYVFFPDARALWLLGWDDHYFRMMGTLFDPNFFGLLLVLIFLWNLLKLPKSLVSVSMLVATLIGLVATYSRASWFTFLLVLGLYFLQKRRQLLKWLFPFIGIVVVFLLLPKPGGEGVNIFRTHSIVSRINSWEAGIQLFKSHPIFGIGFNQYGNYVASEGKYGATYLPKAPDNSFVFVLATSGVVGLLGLVGLVGNWWSEYD